MSTTTGRQEAISAVINYKPGEGVDIEGETSTSLYGTNVFNDGVQRQLLSKPVYKSLKKSIETGAKLDPAIADAVASALKAWAIEKGATHYTHIFYPLTNVTAEKHDSFFDPDGDGGTIAQFGGSALIQAEPDASSFPSGGIRATNAARGYTVWDVTSPAYILENPNGNTLIIPTVFISWTGEALDYKLPLLRSMNVLNTQAQRILKLFGKSAGYITATAGPEQEYFLIDRNFYFARPDLLNAGRTLYGAKPPKGQEFEDHYFGAIPERVLSFMMDAEHEFIKQGIPIKTRHNEVAPGQHEIAPVYESANLAQDHQQLIMQTLTRTAAKYGMAALLHEKPFSGVNGSGKHINWSLGAPGVGNLLDPGDNPHENIQFLAFAAATIRAVHLYSTLLRATVASAGNDFRLGANEAPPAIISVFLGEQLEDVFEQLKKGKPTTSKQAGTLDLGVATLPVVPRHAGDRNRTSPFAFTGNRFEFRAAGSAQTIGWPLVVLNVIVADSLDFIATEVEKISGGDKSKTEDAIITVLSGIANDHLAVVFDGNGYSEEWQVEAAKRGLPNLKNTVDALPAIIDPKNIAVLGKYGVLSEREVTSRYKIAVEQYILTVDTETALALEIAKTKILPAALAYQAQLASLAVDLKTVGLTPDLSILEEVTALTSNLIAGIKEFEEVLAHEGEDEPLVHAKHLRDHVLPVALKVREVVDTLETVVADELWPLPTYQEMLFIK